MKIMLIIACIGHIICGITDCMFAYSKNGRFDFANMKDEGKMKHVFSAMSLRQIEIGMMLGVIDFSTLLFDPDIRASCTM